VHWAPQQPQAPIERPSYRPSQYQQAIINWLMTGTGNALVDAKAGSGKTSTLCML
jgi:superfamily II DNA/RNA helicase